MKKFLRVFVPIILAVAILLCLVWYLFIYDRELTRDVLLSCARYFEQNSNHSLSSWFYEQAYRQAGDNDSVAIELAQQYKNAGNYTKAEFTLTNAIRDGGGAQLYIQLSKLYIEQDKVLDAIKLLDSVCNSDSHVNSEVTAQLSAMRPAAPTATPAPGYYKYYVSVALEAEGGTLYASASNEYPSVLTDQYQAPIQLVAGENTVYAVTISKEGLVSPRAIFGYTIGGVVEEVQFRDSAIEKQIRQLLGVKDDAVVMSDALWAIKEFTVPADAKDLSDLKNLTYLEQLTMEEVADNQLHNISSLSNLTALHIKKTSVTSQDMATIGQLPKLQKLTLSSCGITSLTGLEKATQLTYLDLSDNTIRNLSALRAMTGLTEVYLEHNVVSDLSALSAAASLTRLDVSYNTLTDLTPIYNNTRLTYLNASNNALSSLGQIDKLQKLIHLDLNYNKLTSVAALAALKDLRNLYISNNSLKSISELSANINIEQLDFSYNQVTELPKFSANAMLVAIDGSYNKISKLDSLKGLPQLNKVSMDYNEELSSIEPLATCPLLILVNVYGTKVTEVKILTDMSIVVNYTPVLDN